MKDVHKILYICYLEMINIVSGSTVSSINYRLEIVD